MKYGIVIPAYNESKRLNMNEFRSHQDISFLFVDDGSTDNTVSKIEEMRLDNVKVIRLPINQGKAEAVRHGMLSIQKIFPNLDWIGFWDADLATPLDEIKNAINYSSIFYNNTDSIWCSRLSRLGSSIKRSYLRHLLGRFFITFISLIFNEKVYDSQCGAKLFRTNVVTALFEEPFISRWIFDIEILRRSKISNIKIVEYPLLNWQDISGSKLNIIKTSLRIFLDIYKIKKKYR